MTPEDINQLLQVVNRPVEGGTRVKPKARPDTDAGLRRNLERLSAALNWQPGVVEQAAGIVEQYEAA